MSAKKKTGRPYSRAYTAAGTPRRYLLSGIPAGFWIKVQAQAKRENIAVRQVILMLLEEWLRSFNQPPPTPAVPRKGERGRRRRLPPVPINETQTALPY